MAKTPKKNKSQREASSLVTPSISSRLKYKSLPDGKKVRVGHKKGRKEENKEGEKERKKMSDTAAILAAEAKSVADQAALLLTQSGGSSTGPTPVATGGTPTVTTAITYVLEQDLVLDLLLRPIFDVKAATSHEVLEALKYANITTWRQFTKLQDEDIGDLSKHAPARSGSNRSPIATNYKRELMPYQRMITERK